MLRLLPVAAVVAPALGQGIWRDISPLRSPSARRAPAIAYDSARRRIVLFGGDAERWWRNERWLTDTWEWDGVLWSRRGSPLTPPAGEFRMVYDSKRRVCVLFGGNQETWEWNGSAWIRRQPPARPGVRYGFELAYHEALGKTVLFGGFEPSRNQALGDTWEYDGATWKQLTPFSARARGYHGMTYDGARKLVVLFGGTNSYDRPNAGDSQTWVWDGSNWNRRTDAPPNSSPPHRLAYDAARERVVHHYTFRYNQTQRTFSQEWDGNTWSIVIEHSGLSPATDFEIAYDGRMNRVLRFGGEGFRDPIGETWSYAHDCWIVAEGHLGGGLAITYATRSVLGSRFCLGYRAPQRIGYLFLGASPCRTPWLRVAPPAFCAQGSLYVTPLEIVPGFGNPVLACFDLPRDPSLAGTRLCVQSVGLDAPVCFRATDAVEVTLRLQ